MSTTIQPVPGGDTRMSPKRLARIAGLFYLFVAIFGGFAEGIADPKLYVAGDAAATAGSLVANAALARFNIVAHLANGVFFVLVAMALYLLLNHVNRNAARWMVVLVVISTALTCLNAVFQFEGLRIATDSSWAAALGIAGSHALVLLLLDIQHYGTFAAQVFFGLWLAPLGYLAYKSGMFPKALGVVLVAATVSYLVEVLVVFLVPDIARQAHPLLVIAPLIAEIWLLAYLLVKGVRSPRAADRASVSELAPVAA